MLQAAEAESVLVVAAEYASKPALVFAARQPARVEAMLCWSGSAEALVEAPSRAATPGAVSLYETDYELWVDSILPLLWGGQSYEQHREAARRLMLAAIPPRSRGRPRFMQEEDVREFLPCVDVPVSSCTGAEPLIPARERGAARARSAPSVVARDRGRGGGPLGR